ncbi:hypothetical protein NF867_14480 [Solitalea sp. MAHUQ-68]|uniref:SH3b domain-containing protein n=1 Tax=Solitalea agri TaxID=2953739 RepID=A0A9X2JEL4_9SPHI|nr:hypothetical protein [Solitalea agri]MCO4294070.1 hypothetical protein [Solitalea agri]
MRILILFMLACLTLQAQCQVAIIQDNDGFTNVRSKPNANSEIVYKISVNEVFWYNSEDDDFQKSEWVEVYVLKNKYSFNSIQSETVNGFIHKSRLLPLDKLKIYKASDFNFEYVIQPFKTQNHIIDRDKSQWVSAIDGRHAWGTDGGLPRKEVIKINLTIQGKIIQVSSAFFCDIYECENSFNVYKNGETYFVYQHNSDGAGGYELVWVFTKDGLKQRLVGSII